jgi:hypothetical protein
VSTGPQLVTMGKIVYAAEEAGPKKTLEEIFNKNEKSAKLSKKSADGKDKGESKKDAQEKKIQTVPLMQLYSFADPLDYLLMAFGTIGATLHGVALPLLILTFGQLIDEIGHRSNIQRAVNKVTY